MRRGLPRPTGRAAIVVGVAGVLVVVVGGGLAAASLFALVVVGAFVADAVLVRRQRPTLTRAVPTTIPLLVDAPYSAVVIAPGATDPRVRQPRPPELELEPDEGRGAALASTLRGGRRGRHSLEPLAWRASGPLGLARDDWALGRAVPVTVVPDLPRARRLAARRGAGRDDGRARSRLGLGTEFETVRDYVPDDDIRQVNWTATARTGRLMSNQYRVDENRDVMGVVDAGRLMASPVGLRNRLDVALDALTTLCAEAEACHDRVGALAFSSQILREISPRRLAAGTVVRALFDLEATEVESDYDRAFAAVGRHRRAMVVVFTDLVDDTASRALLEAASVLARRHAVIVATCVDVDLVRAGTGVPVDVHDVLRAAVALDLLAAKDRAAVRLRASGVVVVEAGPEDLGRECVRAYHRLKRRARG